jgi:hypothetical protein
MVSGVVADFVSFSADAAHNIGILCGVLANEKKRGPDAPRFEYVEKLKRENRVRAVIECHRDVRSIHST